MFSIFDVKKLDMMPHILLPFVELQEWANALHHIRFHAPIEEHECVIIRII